ncbi:CMRF35-like molecule 1 isoform X2 [Esox lucius]|uniref:CMRF35-like molecule 1 isoform X2 n=1 Tax=Esox lucius TaxID=8010 RepID=UPI0009731BD0|nr:CMRF35-like molecule 1 isoform X2 [Esox lucius]
MNILHVVYCCLLSGLCVEASPYGVLKVEGGYVTFSCFFGWSENNNKFICKKTCSDEDILVETKGSRNVTQGRYSITDNGNGVFSVTIKDLKKSDSGEYWCGVERSVKDSYKELYLSVRDAENPIVNLRPHVTTTLPNLSTTSIISTTVPNLLATSLDIHTTLPTFTNIHGLSSSGEGTTSYSDARVTAGTPVVFIVCVSLAVLALVLILLLICKWRRDRNSSTPQDYTYQTLNTKL